MNQPEHDPHAEPKNTPRTPDTGSSDAAASRESYPDLSEGMIGPEEVVLLQERVTTLEQEAAEAHAKYLRSLAEFQNYQKRALASEQQARAEGAARVVTSVVNVIDHFDLALGQDMSKASVEQIVGGVRVIRDELMKSLQTHGVGVISPQKGDEFEPGRHEAIMTQPADGVEPGRVVNTFQAGYTLKVSGSERVVRPAKVSVAG